MSGFRRSLFQTAGLFPSLPVVLQPQPPGVRLSILRSTLVLHPNEARAIAADKLTDPALADALNHQRPFTAISAAGFPFVPLPTTVRFHEKIPQ